VLFERKYTISRIGTPLMDGWDPRERVRLRIMDMLLEFGMLPGNQYPAREQQVPINKKKTRITLRKEYILEQKTRNSQPRRCVAFAVAIIASPLLLLYAVASCGIPLLTSGTLLS